MKTFVAIYSINKNCFCTAVTKIGIVLIKTHFLTLRRTPPPETPMCFWSRPVEPT